MKDFKNYIYEAEDAYLEYEGYDETACDIEQVWLAALLNDKPIDEFAAFILATTIVTSRKTPASDSRRQKRFSRTRFTKCTKGTWLRNGKSGISGRA